MEDVRHLELKTQTSGNRISQRLVFSGTDIDVGHQVHRLHERLAATGYQVKVKTAIIEEMAGAGHPMYGVVVEVKGEGVTIEETPTSPNDPPLGKGRRVRFERQFFLDHYDVD